MGPPMNRKSIRSAGYFTSSLLEAESSIVESEIGIGSDSQSSLAVSQSLQEQEQPFIWFAEQELVKPREGCLPSQLTPLAASLENPQAIVRAIGFSLPVRLDLLLSFVTAFPGGGGSLIR